MMRNQWLVLATALAVVGCERNADREEPMAPVAQQGQQQRGATGQQPGAMGQRQGTAQQRGATGQQQGAGQQQGVAQRGQQQGAMQGQVPQHAEVGVRTQQPYGQYIVDQNGRSLYMFTADTQNRSSDCYDQCAQMWPPVLTRDEPRARERDIQQDKLGTIQRRDGTRQVTYNGWPLYTFARDNRAGDVNGQDMHGFGGEWYLMNPQGQKIERRAEHAQR